jgi:TP901 family phage tail tape measure protein
MADRIEQEFIINASQALGELTQLESGLRSFRSTINSVAKSITSLNSVGGGGLASFQSNANGAASAVNTLNGAVAATNTSGSKAIVTFATLSRVIQTQLTVSALSNFKSGIADSIEAAKELQKQIALVATIAQRVDVPGQRNPVDPGEIGAATRSLSDSLNLDQIKVAEGLYAAVSNQVGNFAESLQFSAEAGKFAKATNSTLKDSVDALSSVLKSYGLNADQTGKISDQLFAGIDKGRITATELANSLGRVTPAAAELGVSSAEVVASLAAVSVKGLSAAESLTQIRATLTGLIKPSDAMKAAFDGLGISSAKAGIQQFGLVGLLDKLRESYGQNEQALGKLFPNVRNIGAVFALTGTNLADYQKTLEAVTNSQGKADQAFDTATNTGAEKLSSAYNKVKNSLIDISSQLINSTASILETSGALGLSGESVQAITVSFLGGTAAIIAYTAAAVTLTGANATLSASTLATANSVKTLTLAFAANPLTIFAAGLVATTVAVNALQQSGLDRIQKQFDELNKISLDQASAELKRLSAAGANAIGKFDEFIRGGRTSIQGAISEVNAGIRTLAQDDAAYVNAVGSALDAFLAQREKVLSGLKSTISESARLIEQGKSNIQSLRDEQADLKFDQSTRGLTDGGRATANLRRAAALAREAQEAFDAASTSGDSTGLARSKQLFDQAKSAANNAKGLGSQAEAEKAINDIIEQRIANEERLNGIKAAQAEAAKGQLKETQRLNDEQKAAADEVRRNRSTLDANGQPLRGEDLAKRQAALDEALKRLAPTAPGEIDLARILNAEALRGITEAQLQGLKGTVELELKDGGSKLIAQAEAIFQKFSQEGFVKSFSGGASITPDELDANIDAGKDFLKAQVTADQTFAKGLSDRTAALLAAQEALNIMSRGQGARGALELTGATTLSDALGFSDNAGFAEKIKAALPDLQSIIGQAVSNPDVDVERLRSKFEVIKTTLLEASQNANDVFAEEGQGFRLFEEQLQKVLDATSVVQQAKASAAFTPEAQNGPIQSNIDYYNQLEAAARRAAAAKAAAASTPSGGGDAQGLSFGGRIRSFGNGGIARGVDTIAARLRPGESVLNPRATNRLFGTINALNAGQMPAARGQSSITNVGDIHVNVGGGQSSGTTARDIAIQLRRELRRGTSTL